ncbi:MAG: hypothetical protein AAB669_01470 [Patescibacteria group bacterium]
MSKKKKQNLQKLIAKKQQLQQVAQGAVVSFGESSQIETFQKPESAVVPAPISRPKPSSPSTSSGSPRGYSRGDRALRKTAVSIVVIAALLVTAVIFDQKSPYLNQFGDWIYWALRLQS